MRQQQPSVAARPPDSRAAQIAPAIQCRWVAASGAGVGSAHVCVVCCAPTEQLPSSVLHGRGAAALGSAVGRIGAGSAIGSAPAAWGQTARSVEGAREPDGAGRRPAVLQRCPTASRRAATHAPQVYRPPYAVAGVQHSVPGSAVPMSALLGAQVQYSLPAASWTEPLPQQLSAHVLASAQGAPSSEHLRG